ncbi:DUF6418 domain-containing protein [Persicitalea sp.]|uniref:DUF6418 domain-containing protein n=1 Tax=Persicitalea sp. TaxID=3100273 RepID=UPI003592EC32
MKKGVLNHRSTTDEVGLLGHLLLLTIITSIHVVVVAYNGSTLYDSVFSLICILWAMWAVLSRDTSFFLLFFLIINSIFMVTISCVVIEGGAYMIELFESGYLTGATTRYAFFSLLFLLSAYLIYNSLRGSRLQFNFDAEFSNSKGIMLLFYGVFGVILLFLFGGLVVYGSPLLNGVDRTRYWGQIAPPGTRYFNSLLPQLNFISGIFYTQLTEKKLRRTVVGFFVLCITVQLLQGEKFSGLLLTIFFFYLPTKFLEFRYKNIRITFFLVLKVLGAGLAALISIFVNYTLQYGSPLSGLIMIANRIGLQGQVWWAADRLITNSTLNSEYFIHHVMGFGAEETTRGLNYLMFFLAPPEVSFSYFNSGSGFTAGFPAILLLGTGYLYGVFAVIICGCLIGLVLYLFSIVMIRKKILFALLALKLFFATNLAFEMGDLHLLFSVKYILFIVLSVALYYITIDLFSLNGKRVKI